MRWEAAPLRQRLAGTALRAAATTVRRLPSALVYALADLIGELSDAGTETYIAQLHPEPERLLARLGVAPGAVPEDHIFASAEAAVVAATHGERKRFAANLPGTQTVGT